MKVSVNWLQELIGTPLPATDELIQRIGSQLGEVDGTVNLGPRYAKAVVVEVRECGPLENSDHLNLCRVDDGGITPDVNRGDDGLVQVVCGAPNVRAGLKAVWLPPTAVVPVTYGTAEPFELSARELRGAVSNGMLASPRELAMGDSHEGILELPADAVPGTPFADLAELNDTIIDIENKMFTHRPDCFGQLGVAREVAGILGQQFTSPSWYTAPELPSGEGLNVGLKNEVPKQSQRFMLLPMSGVKVGPSPLWLQSKLVRAGLRPINNVVDATNYIMLLTAQPTHAYDYDKVAKLSSDGAQFVVRAADGKEQLNLLNGKTITPREGALLIATDKTPIGLAGVMGGADTEVDETTTNIVLECASFDMYSIRRTSMHHGLFSDAATRFTKGQSPLQNPAVLAELARVLTEVSGATPAGTVIDDNHAQTVSSVGVSAEFVNARLGVQLTADDMATLLRNVECEVVVQNESLTVTPPFWRTDIEQPEDIVEEIGRLYGFDCLPLELPRRLMTPAARNPLMELKDTIRTSLSRAGASEVLSYSFVPAKLLTAAAQDPQQAFTISNALSPDLQHYRLSLTPSLLEKVHPNIKAGHSEFALFEIGKAHAVGVAGDDGLPAAFERVALTYAADPKVAKMRSGAAFYQARTLLDTLLHALGLKDVVAYTVYDPATYLGSTKLKTTVYNPERTAVVTVGDIVIGEVGEYTSPVRKTLKLPDYSAGFELDIAALQQVAQDVASYKPLSRFPKIEQDVTLKTDASYGELARTFKAALVAAQPEQTDLGLELRGIYQAKDTTSKNTTFRVGLVSAERTLTEAEMTKLIDQAVAAIKVERV